MADLRTLLGLPPYQGAFSPLLSYPPISLGFYLYQKRRTCSYFSLFMSSSTMLSDQALATGTANAY